MRLQLLKCAGPLPIVKLASLCMKRSTEEVLLLGGLQPKPQSQLPKRVLSWLDLMLALCTVLELEQYLQWALDSGAVHGQKEHIIVSELLTLLSGIICINCCCTT